MAGRATAALEERLCAFRAAAAQQDPIGSGGLVPRLLAVEMPTPWGDGFHDGALRGTPQQRMWALRAAYIDALRDADRLDEVVTTTGLPAFYGIAPDPEWSDPTVRRALLITRPEGAFAEFDIAEYRFTAESDDLVRLAEAFFAGDVAPEAFEAYRVEHGGHREVLVCTHGHVDVCCAKLGVPLYRQARAAYPRVRAWRTTHFGGHRYAPTAWEFPSGYKWAFLDEDAAARVLERDGHSADLRMRVRGWSGVPPKAQLLDRVGLERFGWEWLDFARAGEVLEVDEEARRWRVRLDFESPAGERGSYEGIVVVARELHEAGCGPHFGEYDFEVPEYRLESLVER
ncbi:MAG: hypothetical protein GEU80_17275 [Dehalococcoidia bacterium]|nr:hypothetical protein [Dehalococcoidia bacterium]